MAFARFLNRRGLWLAVPLFPLVVGALVMRHSGVDSTIWGQNLVAGLCFTLICIGLRLAMRPPMNRRWWGLAIALSVGLLLGTFADVGFAGVHRWVRVGPVRLHAGEVCLPLLILALGKVWSFPGNKFAGRFVPFLGLGTLALLVCQPDAAQATALAGALLILMYFYRQSPWVLWSVALATVVCAVWAWIRPDPLLPVPYVEGIVELAAQRGASWQWVSLASLALLPWPFLLARGRARGHRPKDLHWVFILA